MFINVKSNLSGTTVYSNICILSDNVRVYNSVNFVYIYLSKIFYLYCKQTFNNHLHHFHTYIWKIQI